MAELIPVNILIGDRNYRIKINPSDEESIRKTTKIINDKIIEFKANFAGKDIQDYIAMVLIWYATQAGSGASLVQEKEIAEELSKLEKLLDHSG